MGPIPGVEESNALDTAPRRGLCCILAVELASVAIDSVEQHLIDVGLDPVALDLVAV